MNIYKLQKLAAAWWGFDSLAFHAPWPKRVPKKNRTVRYLDKCKAADIDFTRHCRNNFMRALEALKDAKEEGWIPEAIDLDQLIKELEEVK